MILPVKIRRRRYYLRYLTIGSPTDVCEYRKNTNVVNFYHLSKKREKKKGKKKEKKAKSLL